MVPLRARGPQSARSSSSLQILLLRSGWHLPSATPGAAASLHGHAMDTRSTRDATQPLCTGSATLQAARWGSHGSACTQDCPGRTRATSQHISNSTPQGRTDAKALALQAGPGTQAPACTVVFAALFSRTCSRPVDCQNGKIVWADSSDIVLCFQCCAQPPVCIARCERHYTHCRTGAVLASALSRR